jgi:hypothetical protein
MSCVFDRPAVTLQLATAIRLVDAFTGVALRERYDVRLAGREDWLPVFRVSDATYRFVVSNEPVPALGAVTVTITAPAGATHRDADGLSVTIPPAAAPPVPLTVGYFIGEHALWPARTFRPPPGETFVRGRVLRAGAPLPDHRVRIAAGGPPASTVPAAPTDADGEFSYRLPGLRILAQPSGVTDTADLHAEVQDPAGTVQAIAAPTLPITVPIGRTTALTLDLA